MSEGFYGWTIAQFERAFRQGTVSPVEVARWAVAEASGINTRFGTALTFVAEQEATDMARASERRWLDGNPRGPLDGVPATIKNLLTVAGWPLDSCSWTVERGTTAGNDAPAVARLREAGMVFLGYTSTPEFSWKLVTDSPRYGPLANPHDPSRTAGGSSGGAAVCAAVGLAPVNLGSDAAGSIRVPASFCGVFGMKPTFGTVAAHPASSLTHIGPIARSVRDAAIVLDAIGRPNRRDWYNTPFERTDAFSHAIGRSLNGLRVAYAPDFAGQTAEPEVTNNVDIAVRRLEALGAHVEVKSPQIIDPREAARILFSGGYIPRLRSMSAELRARADPALVAMASAAETHGADDLRRANDHRYQLGCQLSMFFEDFDLLVTPTTACPAFPLGQNMPAGAQDEIVSWSAYTYTFNLAHNPAASLPCGVTPDGLPIGVQLVGPKFGDALVLSVSALLADSSG